MIKRSIFGNYVEYSICGVLQSGPEQNFNQGDCSDGLQCVCRYSVSINHPSTKACASHTHTHPPTHTHACLLARSQLLGLPESIGRFEGGNWKGRKRGRGKKENKSGGCTSCNRHVWTCLGRWPEAIGKDASAFHSWVDVGMLAGSTGRRASGGRQVVPVQISIQLIKVQQPCFLLQEWFIMCFFLQGGGTPFCSPDSSK